jgi:hypothetical protein
VYRHHILHLTSIPDTHLFQDHPLHHYTTLSYTPTHLHDGYRHYFSRLLCHAFSHSRGKNLPPGQQHSLHLPLPVQSPAACNYHTPTLSAQTPTHPRRSTHHAATPRAHFRPQQERVVARSLRPPPVHPTRPASRDHHQRRGLREALPTALRTVQSRCGLPARLATILCRSVRQARGLRLPSPRRLRQDQRHDHGKDGYRTRLFICSWGRGHGHCQCHPSQSIGQVRSTVDFWGSPPSATPLGNMHDVVPTQFHGIMITIDHLDESGFRRLLISSCFFVSLGVWPRGSAGYVISSSSSSSSSHI